MNTFGITPGLPSFVVDISLAEDVLTKQRRVFLVFVTTRDGDSFYGTQLPPHIGGFTSKVLANISRL